VAEAASGLGGLHGFLRSRGAMEPPLSPLHFLEERRRKKERKKKGRRNQPPL